MTPRSILGVAAVALVASACGDDEHVDPVGLGGGSSVSSSEVASSGGVTSTADASSSSSGAGGEEPGPPIRTFIQRDPFGNVAETQNLLWDGDFEWHSTFADQYGWYQGQAANLTQTRVGPECHSGIKCAVLGADLIGLAVSSAEHDLYVSAWIKPPQPSCDNFGVFLLADGIYDDSVDLPISAAFPEPDDTGWCHFEGVVPQRDDKAYLYVSNSNVGAPSLFDDAVIREATSDESRRVAPLAAWVPSEDTAKKLTAARETIRKWRGPHDGAPNPTREAFHRWSRGEGRIQLKASPRTTGGSPR